MRKFDKAINHYIYWKALGARPRILYSESNRTYFVALIVPPSMLQRTDWQIVHG